MIRILSNRQNVTEKQNICHSLKDKVTRVHTNTLRKDLEHH